MSSPSEKELTFLNVKKQITLLQPDAEQGKIFILSAMFTPGKTIPHPNQSNTDQNKPGPQVLPGAYRCYFVVNNKAQITFNCRKGFTFLRTSAPQ